MIANSALFGAQRDRVASRIPSRPYRRRSRVAGNSKPLHIWAGTGAYLENVGLSLFRERQMPAAFFSSSTIVAIPTSISCSALMTTKSSLAISGRHHGRQ